jgi:hypothetical protein
MRRLLDLTAMLVFFAGIAFSQSKPIETKSQRAPDQRTSPFRYVIVSDVTVLQKAINDNPSLRNVEVLMEDAAFTEPNLIKLSQLLTKRFADRQGLFVQIFTSLDAIRTPEEYDEIGLGGLREDYRNYKYALFIRDKAGERLVYEIPGVQERKEIVMKTSSANGNSR